MKKCAVINDLSGFGKCSLGVALPIISVMGSEVHPLPTAVLSNQTAYDSYAMRSLTANMPSFIDEWKKLNVTFDAILTGFVSDAKQLDIINDFTDEFKTENTVLIVDPIMADNGSLYDCFNEEICEKMKKLCFKADIITPNISELAIIAGGDNISDLDTLVGYCKTLGEKGIKKIVATGYKSGGELINIIFDNGNVGFAKARELGGYYSGTGDIFSSIVTGGTLRGMSLFDSASLACEFIKKVIENTDDVDHNGGIDFEKYLGELAL
ncbi:MAG: pyridoxamine kinase [Clostridiales bacterium]|nr:pyridoxamine kinase [Clostridiales bacterium]